MQLRQQATEITGIWRDRKSPKPQTPKFNVKHIQHMHIDTHGDRKNKKCLAACTFEGDLLDQLSQTKRPLWYFNDACTCLFLVSLGIPVSEAHTPQAYNTNKVCKKQRVCTCETGDVTTRKRKKEEERKKKGRGPEGKPGLEQDASSLRGGLAESVFINKEALATSSSHQAQYQFEMLCDAVKLAREVAHRSR